MLDSLERLRKDADMCTVMVSGEDGLEVVWMTKSAHLKDLDAIEYEVEERYIEGPKDKNGEQVYVGDTVHDHENGYDFRVDGFQLWGNMTEWWAFQDQAVQQKLENCSIVKPPTVEEVLREFGRGWHEQMNGPETFDIADYVERYAAKLQLRGEHDG